MFVEKMTTINVKEQRKLIIESIAQRGASQPTLESDPYGIQTRNIKKKKTDTDKEAHIISVPQADNLYPLNNLLLRNKRS